MAQADGIPALAAHLFEDGKIDFGDTHKSGQTNTRVLGLTKQSDQLERTPNRILDFRGIDSSGGRTPCQHVR